MTYSGNQNACRGILRFFRLFPPCSLFACLFGTRRFFYSLFSLVRAARKMSETYVYTVSWQRVNFPPSVALRRHLPPMGGDESTSPQHISITFLTRDAVLLLSPSGGGWRVSAGQGANICLPGKTFDLCGEARFFPPLSPYGDISPQWGATRVPPRNT